MAQLQSSDRRCLKHFSWRKFSKRDSRRCRKQKVRFGRKRNTHVDRCPQWWGTLGLPPVTPTLARELNPPELSWWGRSTSIRKRWGINHPCVRDTLVRDTYSTITLIRCFISVARNRGNRFCSPRHAIFFFLPLTLSTVDRAIFFPRRNPSDDASFGILERLIEIRRWKIFGASFLFDRTLFEEFAARLASSLMLDSGFIFIYIYIRYCFRLEANLG